ncbi:MAG TPA: amidohydrolase/deacetylase family metallohydrolase [Candidatus Limnocylindrales bacterium]|nr:amidohydrolase/deacetylase family metallohydrolase [Candidatus Limnocylindrales bacterium]
MTVNYDLLLKGGEVIDPSSNIRGRRDVAFCNGKIAAVAENIAAAEARQTIDVAGKLVTPGLIDIHGHFFHGYQPRFEHPDIFCLPTGVTTAVDAGSAGWKVFGDFRDRVINRCSTRLFAFVHISANGLNKEHTQQGELMDMKLIHVKETARCIVDNPENIVGLKVRIDDSALRVENAFPALEYAREAANRAGCRIMVHVSRSPIPLGQILDFLRPGDIVTHPFHGAANGSLDDKGKVRPEVIDAQKRGIILDSGCAKVHLDVNVCRAFLDQEILPDTLSTDGVRLDRSYTLAQVMSMFLALGMSLEQIIAATTHKAAAAIGKEATLGSLRVGAAGDATVLNLEDGDFAFDDRAGNVIKCQRQLAPVLTVRNGVRWEQKIATV